MTKENKAINGCFDLIKNQIAQKEENDRIVTEFGTGQIMNTGIVSIASDKSMFIDENPNNEKTNVK